MICDRIINKDNYSEINDKIAQALDILYKLKESNLKLGRNDIKESIYINFMNYQTDNKENKIWESHQQYLDIHYILEGEEKILISDKSTMIVTKLYEHSIDAAFYEGKEEISLILEKGMFLVCFPQDVHKVGVSNNHISDVKKVVCKVKI